jgi:threonine dehydratase
VRVGTVPFAHHQAYVDDVVTVDDAALPRAMRALLDRLKLVAEPSGAITLAALAEGVVTPAAEGHTVCVLSGGNVEWDGLCRTFCGAAGVAARADAGATGAPPAGPAR